jgi:quercetin dioxygenase-like cupin family protein
MKEKRQDATINRPQGERIIDAPSLVIDIRAYIRQIKSEEAWQKNDRNSITIFKTGDMRIVVGALHKEAEFLPHKAEGNMCMQIIEGSLEVMTDELTEQLQPEEMIAIHKDSNYRFVALEETVYILTISEVGNNTNNGIH